MLPCSLTSAGGPQRSPPPPAKSSGVQPRVGARDGKAGLHGLGPEFGGPTGGRGVLSALDVGCPRPLRDESLGPNSCVWEEGPQEPEWGAGAKAQSCGPGASRRAGQSRAVCWLGGTPAEPQAGGDRTTGRCRQVSRHSSGPSRVPGVLTWKEEGCRGVGQLGQVRLERKGLLT